MTDQTYRTLESIPRPDRIRQDLARRAREVRLLRQLLKLSERIAAAERSREPEQHNA